MPLKVSALFSFGASSPPRRTASEGAASIHFLALLQALTLSSVYILTRTTTLLLLSTTVIIMKSAVVTPADVPKAANFDVRTSSFFRHHHQLPSPEEVRSRARAQYLACTHWGWKTRDVSKVYNARPAPAVFEDMSLFVKWGSDVKITEGQTLYAIRNSCGNSVPVPEIYGWRMDGDETFLYMEAIRGKTLEDAWPEMKEDDRLRICSELRTILHNLRQLKQNPLDKFIGELACVLALFITPLILTSNTQAISQEVATTRELSFWHPNPRPGRSLL